MPEATKKHLTESEPSPVLHITNKIRGAPGCKHVTPYQTPGWCEPLPFIQPYQHSGLQYDAGKTFMSGWGTLQNNSNDMTNIEAYFLIIIAKVIVTAFTASTFALSLSRDGNLRSNKPPIRLLKVPAKQATYGGSQI